MVICSYLLKEIRLLNFEPETTTIESVIYDSSGWVILTF